MKRHWSVFAPSAVLLLLAGCSPVRNPVSEPEVPRNIPLESVYSTSAQEGLKRIHWSDEPYGGYLDQIESNCKKGPTNVVLVRGKDLPAAVKAAFSVLLGSLWDGTVVYGDGPPSDQEQIWAVAYLGQGRSTSPAYLLASVEVTYNSVRLLYQVPELAPAADDSHAFLYFVPLGQLRSDTYYVELFDVDKRDWTLMRRMAVPGK